MAEGQRPFFPEQRNRQPLRGRQERGGTRLGISAPPRRGEVIAPDRPAPVPTIPPPDTTTPIPEQTPQKPRRHTVRNIALAGTALGVLGAGAYEAYQNIPAVHRAVGSAFLDNIRGKSLSSESLAFDNSETKGKISLNNILYIPKEDFDKTPLSDEEGNPILDFPWDSNNPVEIKYEKSLFPKPDWWKSDVDPNTEIKNNFEASTVLPAGFEFTTPYPGRVFFAANPYNAEEIQMAKVEFIAPDGILYFINIEIRDNNGSVILEPLIDAPLLGEGNRNGKDWEKGTLVERGQKIFSPTQKGKLLMHIQGGKNGRFEGPETNIVPGNFRFQTGKDLNGVEKLLVPETK